MAQGTRAQEEERRLVSSALRALATLLLALVSIVLATILADLAFRFYESHFLREEIPLGAGTFDLERLGFNDHEGFLNAERQPGEFRILSFGDSFAESPTLAIYTYAAVTQELLTAETGRRVRVVNFGKALTTFPDYLRDYGSWSKRIEREFAVMPSWMR